MDDNVPGAPASGTISGIEIGVDGGLQFTFRDSGDDVTSAFAPGRWVRVGLPVSEHVGIEPVLGLGYDRTQDSGALSVQFFPHLVYDISGDRARGTYFRVGAGIDHFDTTERDGGATAIGLGGGVGARIPVAGTTALRVEAAFAHWFESDLVDPYSLAQVLVGLSFFVGRD